MHSVGPVRAFEKWREVELGLSMPEAGEDPIEWDLVGMNYALNFAITLQHVLALQVREPLTLWLHKQSYIQ